MNNSLEGKVAIVTGAGRGLGRAIAATLSSAGALVAVASRTEDQLASVVAEIEAAGGRALAVPTDVTDESSVGRLVDRTLEAFGSVDVLVNNSGVLSTVPLLEQAADDWDRILDTNLRGAYLATRAVGKHLVAQGSGKVINVASNFGLMGVPNHAAYAASKAGLIAFTKCMAVEWARHHVQVNALAPGYFATELNAELRADVAAADKVLMAIPARRMGRADELSPWVLLLAGAASDFMTGETIVIDGGQSAK